MSSPRPGTRWRHHRPPWWPPEEPWPPLDAAGLAWRGMRARFFRRVALGFALVAAMTLGLVLVVAWLAVHMLGPVGPHRWGRLFGGPLALALLIGMIVAIRAFRRLAAPIGDLMEGTARVADGEYSVRVPERGPREARSLVRAFNRMAERLQRQNEQRRSLLADVSHELRTPLTVLQGNLEGLLDGVYERDDAHLQAVLEETQVLARLIEDLRTLAVTDDAGLRLVRVPSDVAELAQETVASFRGRADAAHVSLDVEIPKPLPPVLMDVERIRQVLTNLIDNGLRFTPPGGSIRLTAVATDRDVAITVADIGSGIPADHLPHVFDRFYKSRDSGGAGLGLAVAKGLVEGHGGTISVESAVGQGTRMRFTLPLGIATRGSTPG
jgi:signal transduction histidine kinase